MKVERHLFPTSPLCSDYLAFSLGADRRQRQRVTVAVFHGYFSYQALLGIVPEFDIELAVVSAPEPIMRAILYLRVGAEAFQSAYHVFTCIGVKEGHSFTPELRTGQTPVGHGPNVRADNLLGVVHLHYQGIR